MVPVPLAALWLPIVLSAVIVFVASSIMHMVLPYHRSDYKPLPDEEKFLGLLRPSNIARGLYVFPYCCLLYTSPSPRDRTRSRMPSSA